MCSNVLTQQNDPCNTRTQQSHRWASGDQKAEDASRSKDNDSQSVSDVCCINCRHIKSSKANNWLRHYCQRVFQIAAEGLWPTFLCWISLEDFSEQQRACKRHHSFPSTKSSFRFLLWHSEVDFLVCFASFMGGIFLPCLRDISSISEATCTNIQEYHSTIIHSSFA